MFIVSDLVSLSRHIPEHKQNAFSGKKVTIWHNSGAVL